MRVEGRLASMYALISEHALWTLSGGSKYGMLAVKPMKVVASSSA